MTSVSAVIVERHLLGILSSSALRPFDYEHERRRGVIEYEYDASRPARVTEATGPSFGGKNTLLL